MKNETTKQSFDEYRQDKINQLMVKLKCSYTEAMIITLLEEMNYKLHLLNKKGMS